MSILDIDVTELSVAGLAGTLASLGKQHKRLHHCVETQYLFDSIILATTWLDFHTSPVADCDPDWDDVGHEIVRELEAVYKAVERHSLSSIHYYDLVNRTFSETPWISPRAFNWILTNVYIPILSN